MAGPIDRKADSPTEIHGEFSKRCVTTRLGVTDEFRVVSGRDPEIICDRIDRNAADISDAVAGGDRRALPATPRSPQPDRFGATAQAEEQLALAVDGDVAKACPGIEF